MEDHAKNDHTDPFLLALDGLKSMSKKRDPRSIRLAAVTSAVVDVASSAAAPQKLSPASMYASTVAALEGTLSNENAAADLATQVALLELFSTIVAHVAPRTLQATFTITSRALRALVASTQAVLITEETQDELGGLNATLRGACRAATQVLKFVSVGEHKQVQQFLEATLLTMFHDKRPKVRKAAQNGILELLKQESPNAMIQKSIMSYAHSVLARATKQATSPKYNQSTNPDLLHLLGFLERAVVLMDTQKLRDDIMKLLMVFLQETHDDKDSSTTDFLATAQVKRDRTPKIIAINGLLSVMMILIGDENQQMNNDTNAFCARVLASLLQGRPTSTFLSSDEAVLETGQILYGRLMLTACQRVLSSDSEQQQQVGFKLLPLTVQMVLQLSRPTDMDTTTAAEDLMVELTQTFRIMQRQQGLKQQQQQQCWTECLKIMKQYLLEQQQLVFRPTWSCTLTPVALLVEFLAANAEAECKATVTSLVNICNSVQNSGPSKQAVEECLGNIIQSVGIEVFWSWIDWTPKDSAAISNKKKQTTVVPISRDLPFQHSWLLSLLKTSSSNSAYQPGFSFFLKEVLTLARKCDAGGSKGKQQHKLFLKAQVVDLWNLFPCCCQNPSDISESFLALAEGTLVKAVGDTRYPELVAIICSGLKTLASGVSERIKGDDSEYAQGDARVLGQVSTKLLPTLFKLVETLQGTATKASSETEPRTDGDEMDTEAPPEEKNRMSQDAQKVQCVTDAIAEFSKLAPRPFLQALFKKIMHRLLAATQSETDQTEKICTLLGLVQALVASEALDKDSISLLYRSLKPFIRTDEFEARVQKRAYKVLAEICQRYNEFATAPDRLEEMTELLVGSIMTCQVSARHMRLKCMTRVVKGFDSSNTQQMDVIPKVVPEVLLCLKDSNGKTREAAYQLLLSMSSVRDDMTEYVRIIIAALGAQTPHMRSAAVMALSRLVFEYAREDVMFQNLLPSLLQTVIVLFDENAREVIKSVVSYVRVSVAAMTPQQLEPLLPELVGGMFKYHRGKSRFRAKIKIIVKKLVRNFGYDALMPLIPESDTRLLNHIRKIDERTKRRKAAQRQDGTPAEDNGFDDMMESDEEDSDDGRTLMTGATGFTMMTGRTGKSVRTAAITAANERREKRSLAASSRASIQTKQTESGIRAPRLRAENDNEVIDMLDPKMAKNVRFADINADDDSDMDGGVMEFDDTGRLIVPDDLDNDMADGDGAAVDDDAENDEIKLGGKKRRLGKFESAKVARDEAKQRKNKQKQPKGLGDAYKSKKAGGDVMKKGQKYEPYAYVPLDGRSYTKKNRRQAVEQMSSVVRGGKRKR